MRDYEDRRGLVAELTAPIGNFCYETIRGLTPLSLRNSNVEPSALTIVGIGSITGAFISRGYLVNGEEHIAMIEGAASQLEAVADNPESTFEEAYQPVAELHVSNTGYHSSRLGIPHTHQIVAGIDDATVSLDTLDNHAVDQVHMATVQTIDDLNALASRQELYHDLGGVGIALSAAIFVGYLSGLVKRVLRKEHIPISHYY